MTTINKVFKSGDLNKDVYPIYNELINGKMIIKNIDRLKNYISALPSPRSNFVDDLGLIKISLSKIQEGLRRKAQLFDRLDISAARRTQIESGFSRYLRDVDGDIYSIMEEIPTSPAQWVKRIRTRITDNYAKGQGNKNIRSAETVENKRLIDEYLEAIEQIP